MGAGAAEPGGTTAAEATRSRGLFASVYRAGTNLTPQVRLEPPVGIEPMTNFITRVATGGPSVHESTKAQVRAVTDAVGASPV